MAPLFGASCERSPRPPTPLGPATTAWFQDASDEVGLTFDHDAGEPGTYFMPEVIGSGAAFLDADGDRRLDVYLLHNAAPERNARHQLFRQGPAGQFTAASGGSGLEVAGRGMGVAVGDADNDGQVEVLVTEYGAARFFHNQGGGRFAEITAAAGIDNPFWGASASFLDHDRDGWLDLVIANYVLYSPTRPCSDQAGRRDYCGPQPFPGTAAKLFRNVTAQAAPRAPRFADVTVASGLARATGPGLGVLCADFTGDGWVDILVANDGKPNFLWVNQQNGTFAEEAVLRGLAVNSMGVPQADMGIAVGDVDGDQLFDLFLTHLTEEHHILLRQGPRGQFLDATAAAGLTTPAWRSTGFGTVLGDFDLDGDLDLALANGRVKFTTGPSPPGASFWDAYRERSQLFAGDGRGGFRDVSEANPAFCGAAAIARGLATGDVDEDGDLDLLLTRVAERARLLRNVATRAGGWLLVRAIDPALGGRDALGAEVSVTAGGRRIWGLAQPAQSYLSSCDPRVHFGLGAAETVERIEVAWPDGSRETFPGGATNRPVTLEKGRGAPAGEGR